MDIYNQLLNAYNSINNTNQIVATKDNEKNIDDNKSRKILNIYKKMNKNKKLEILCSLTTSTHEIKTVSKELEQDKCLDIFNIISSGTSSCNDKKNIESDDIFINNLIQVPLLEYCNV